MIGRGRTWRRLVGSGGGLALVASAVVAQEKAPAPAVTSFAVFVLSRGKGVPPEARDALRRVAEVVDADERRGVRVETRRTRIGLEGETRLCVEYQSPADARRGLEQVEKIVKDVDLVNLVPGPCAEPAKAREKEKKP
jgi:hypothetical protein